MQEISFCLAGTSNVFELVDPLKKALRQPSFRSITVSSVSKVHLERARLTNYAKNTPRKAEIERLSSRSYNLLDSISSERKMSLSEVNRVRVDRPTITISMEGDSAIVMKVVLSLRTLGTLSDRDNHDYNYFSMLLLFVRDIAVQYLSHPKMEVRREAAITCCRLILPKNNDNRAGTLVIGNGGKSFTEAVNFGDASRNIVEEVLHKLLQVSVSDPSPLVRLCIVSNFDSRYIPFLCQAHNVQPLFLLLQDEMPAVREKVLCLLGNLALYNPTLVLPYLRRMLMDMIVELRCSSESSGAGREAATRLLTIFLRAEALNSIIHPFLSSIIQSLPLKGVSPRLASVTLEALGELAIVTKDEMIPWVGKLIPYIIETMQDQSSASKQHISFKILGQLVEGTGYVILPYIDYPKILPLATSILPSAKRSPWMLRREIMRTFGLMGALDPHRYNKMLRQSQKGRRTGRVGGGLYIDSQDEEVDDENEKLSLEGGTSSELVKRGLEDSSDDSEPAHLYMYELYAMTAQPISKLLPPRRLTPSDEEFYPTVVVQALTRILKDSSLVVHHGMVMQGMVIFIPPMLIRHLQI